METQALPRVSRPKGRDICLAGTLETWPLADIVLWMHQTRRSGMVRVGAGLRAGVLFFHGGELFRCEWGRLRGEQALLALLELQRGAFSLIQREPPEAVPNVVRSTSELLLQLAIANDELAHAGLA